jgi:hypothetical protein
MVWVCCASGTTSRVPLSPGQRLRLPAAWVLLECWLIAHVRVARTRWLLNWWFCCTIAWPNELTCVPTLLFLLWVPVCSCVSRILCSRVHLALWFLRSDCLLCGIHSLRCVYQCALFISLRCVCALSLFVCYYFCMLCVACSRVSLCSMYSCILCCDPMLCLSPMRYSFCALYASMRAIYFSTMCACSISFRVLIFLVLCESYSYVFLCYIPCIPAYILWCISFYALFVSSMVSISECSMYLCVLYTSVWCVYCSFLCAVSACILHRIYVFSVQYLYSVCAFPVPCLYVVFAVSV